MNKGFVALLASVSLTCDAVRNGELEKIEKYDEAYIVDAEALAVHEGQAEAENHVLKFQVSQLQEEVEDLKKQLAALQKTQIAQRDVSAMDASTNEWKLAIIGRGWPYPPDQKKQEWCEEFLRLLAPQLKSSGKLEMSQSLIAGCWPKKGEEEPDKEGQMCGDDWPIQTTFAQAWTGPPGAFYNYKKGDVPFPQVFPKSKVLFLVLGGNPNIVAGPAMSAGYEVEQATLRDANTKVIGVEMFGGAAVSLKKNEETVTVKMEHIKVEQGWESKKKETAQNAVNQILKLA